MPDPLRWIADELTSLTQRSLRRTLLTRENAQHANDVQFNGTSFLNFGANDYLGLATDARVLSAARRALDSVGWGAGASPLVTGRGSWHARLEQELAAFEGTAAALLFPTGYAANVGAITALAAAGDIIFSDAKNHASIIDGCRLSGAKIVIYPHANSDALRQMLPAAQSFRRRLIVTDSLFSMDGDFAPLPQLADLAEQYDAILLIDEAHATGIYGEQGRGVAEAMQVESGVHVRVGTLSKALGSHGGFVSGSQDLIAYLANRARPYIYSTAAPEAASAAALTAVEIVQTEPQRRQELVSRAEQFRSQLQEDGWNLGSSTSQIIPVILCDPARTQAWATLLREQGFWVPGIRPPSVPEGESLLRISLSWQHTPAHLAQLRAALQALATN
jgi:8-amino-7-oxononanoate synthase